MSVALRARQYYDDNNSGSNYTTIIVVVVVILVIKICLIIGLCYYRNKKRAERRARGCHCFEDSDYYCLPWWYWSSDRRCHCGAYNGTQYNAPQYSTVSPPGYMQSLYSAVPAAETGYSNAPAQPPMELKPADSAYMNGRYA